MSDNNSYEPRFNQNQNWPFQQHEPFRPLSGHPVPGKPTPFEAPNMSSSNASPHGQHPMSSLRFPGEQPQQFQFHDFNTRPMPGAPPLVPQPHQFQGMQQQQQQNVYPIHTNGGINTGSN
ncbi:hypothetical protein BGZ68_003799, partial [Mortierella alpina]